MLVSYCVVYVHLVVLCGCETDNLYWKHIDCVSFGVQYMIALYERRYNFQLWDIMFFKLAIDSHCY
jgi:hypothetical protein